MKVVIIGGGPAGMMAAIAAAYNGNEVSIYEKNEKLGKKLFITGKGRCNVTNAGTLEDIESHIVKNSKFMYSSLSEYNNIDIYDFFESRNCKLKVERGNRVFPVTDKSSDIIKTLKKEIDNLNIKVFLNTNIIDIKEKDGKFYYLITNKNEKIFADKCIVATGGKSYPVTGSIGDGYRWGKNLGHNVITVLPALVPLVLKEKEAGTLQGLSLKNVDVQFIYKDKVIYEEMGEMLFTHYGINLISYIFFF